MRSWASLLAIAMSGIGLVAAATARAAAPAAADAGQQLLERFECARCHDGAGLPVPPLEKHCTHCHQEILRGTFKAPPDALARWQKNLHSLPYVPTLVNVGARFERGWLERFLLAPHELRPGLPAMMPRLAISPAEARLVAAALVPAAAPAAPPPASDSQLLKQGRELLESKGCITCHRFSGVAALTPKPLPAAVAAQLKEGQLAMGIALAPDLRHARGRFQPGAISAWLRNPSQLKPDTAMPAIALSDSEVAALAAYIWSAPLAAEPVPAAAVRLPLLTRRVTWDEVSERVFRRTCWHCHSTPEFAMGDGGPGNTGGFGFRGRGLNVASYSDITAGSLDDAGERRSVFLPLSDGVPRIVAHLLARHAELAGQPVPGVRGMPLGLPPLTLEQINLVDSWIAQGRPR